MYIFLGIVIAIIGAFMLLKPESFYKFTESWKSSTPAEPSDLYILNARIGGGIFLVLGIAGAIVLAVLG